VPLQGVLRHRRVVSVGIISCTHSSSLLVFTMEEDQRYERFDLDNDFEGGQFIGDEFFFSKQKRKRQQTKEDAIYGYMTDSDEEDGRRRGPRQKADYTKPVGFISSGITGGTAEKPDKEDDDAEERPGMGLGFSATNGRAGLGLGASEQKPLEEDEEEEGEEDVLPGAFGRR
jgi:tuftelin-interacting protein 11